MLVPSFSENIAVHRSVSLGPTQLKTNNIVQYGARRYKCTELETDITSSKLFCSLFVDMGDKKKHERAQDNKCHYLIGSIYGDQTGVKEIGFHVHQ